MAIIANKTKAIISAILVAAAGLTAGGVALASTPGSAGTAGSPSALAAPKVFIATHNGSIYIPFSTQHPGSVTITALNLPAGSYTVTAKAWMQNQAGGGNSSVFCRLRLGRASDKSQVDAQDGNPGTGTEPVRNEMLILTLTGNVRYGGPVKMICKNYGGGNTYLKFIKVTAIATRRIIKRTF